MSSFVKRLVLSMVASKLERAARRRGYSPVVSGLLREVDHHLTRRRRCGRFGHLGRFGRVGHYGDYGHYDHYRYHGHFRRRHW